MCCVTRLLTLFAFLGVSGFNNEFTYWALLGDEEVWDFLWAELLGFWSIIYYVARAWAMLPSSEVSLVLLFLLLRRSDCIFTQFGKLHLLMNGYTMAVLMS